MSEAFLWVFYYRVPFHCSATVELLDAGRMEFLSDTGPDSSTITKSISDHLLVL